jgi:hypothetical protein
MSKSVPVNLKVPPSRWNPIPAMAARIALCYAVLGGLWILCSGWLLHHFVRDSNPFHGACIQRIARRCRRVWTAEEVMRSAWDARLHPDEIALIRQSRAANFAGQTTLIEHRIRCRDGSWMWVEARSKPLFGPAGQETQLLIWQHDITGRKELETQLRLPGCVGHRMRHGRGDLKASLRTVLHHQRARQGNRARLGHGSRYRGTAQRLGGGGE